MCQNVNGEFGQSSPSLYKGIPVSLRCSTAGVPAALLGFELLLVFGFHANAIVVCLH